MGGMPKVAGCAVQQVSVAAYCTEYIISSLPICAAAWGGHPAPGLALDGRNDSS
jgi:hypothetical protein